MSKYPRDYDKILNIKLINETKVLFDKLQSLLIMKTGQKLSKASIARHAIAITRDYYSGRTTGYKGKHNG